MLDGLLTFIEELRVNTIIIGKQFEVSSNYKKFMEIVKQKKISLKVVEAKQRINIEKDLYFDILWPDSKNKITDNILNNNSLVFKLVYKNFSCVFTGDIEEIAEKAILGKYKDTNILKSTILKVAHHGSKTSSTQEFLNAVKPQIALIGVGSNNKFGHPSDKTLKNLKDINCKIYRTDINGEITIKVNKKEEVLIDKMLD